METASSFKARTDAVLSRIGADVLFYDESEFWMIRSPYEYIEAHAYERRLLNTAAALPLARGLHNGVHRKFCMVKDDVSYRVPYMIHPLMVCRMLMDLQVPLSADEEDILLASALCHDMIEDLPFEDHGRELYTVYGLDRRVYETVLKLSKRKDFTKQEEEAHFRGIREDRLAVLIKLSDRGNNVEDLYNMSLKKVHEYIHETQEYILPMCAYAKENYPSLALAVSVLEDKMLCLTGISGVLAERYDRNEKELHQKYEALLAENERLRAEWKALSEQRENKEAKEGAVQQ